MELTDLLADELFKLAESEIKEQFEAIKAESIIKKLNSTQFGDGIKSGSEILNLFKENKELVKLTKTTLAFEFFLSLETANVKEIKTDIESLESILKDNAQNSYFSLLWLIQNMYVLLAEGAIDKEIAKFLSYTFEKFDFLINKDGFINKSQLLQLKQPGHWTAEFYAPIFKKAIEKYPQKHIFKSKLVEIYYENGNYQLACNLANEFISKLPHEVVNNFLNKDYTQIDYYKLFQIRCVLRLILGEKEKAFADANFIIENIPNERIDNFIPTLFSRMNICLLNKDMDAFRIDCQIIKDWELLFDMYEDAYPDVFKFIDKIKANAIS